jgi:hypothetical protein
MKKLSLLFLGFFAFASFAIAQNITADLFTDPQNTGANMTVGINSTVFDQFAGSEIAAFHDLGDDGSLNCVGKVSVGNGFFGLALWGDDSSTPEEDGLQSGDVVQFAIYHDGLVVLVDEMPEFTGYTTNSIVQVTGAVLSTSSGLCQEEGACNFSQGLDDVDYQGDSNCSFPDQYYDCDGVCLNDTDGDGICNELEIVDCGEADACNYNSEATDNDFDSCIFPASYYDCAGECLSDVDGDGVCDELEVVGCQDAAYANYDLTATDEGDCQGLLGCTDSNYFEFDESAEVNDGSCATEIVPGCTIPSAENYNSAANIDDESCEFGEINPCGNSVTSNNMSVLFPANNAGLWDASSDIQEGDILFAVHEVSTSTVDLVGYSAISQINSAGCATWSGDQVGVAIFGQDNLADNGYEPGEDIVWLVKRDGEVYNASVSYATGGYNGTYDDAGFVTASGIHLGSLYFKGCTDPTYMEYNPLATTSDPAACETKISIGCMDLSAVNYAGSVDVDLDVNATNYGAPFSENLTLDLNTGQSAPSDSPAIFNDPTMCQTDLEGCTDPMALNYNPKATMNSTGACDWSLNGMKVYDVDENGEALETTFNFGAVAAENENDGFLNGSSDFANAQTVYLDGGLDPSAHVINNLASLMEWVDADEAADDALLAETISASDALLAETISASDALLASTIADYEAQLDDKDLLFAQAAADAIILLNSTIESAANQLAETIAASDALLAETIAASDALLAETIAASDALLAETVSASDDLLASTISSMQSDYDANDAAHVTLEGLITDSLNYHRAPIEIDMHTGWNTVGYYLHHESPVVAQFEAQFDSEAGIQDNINIVKNNEGAFYWPDFLFDGLGMLMPGQGYQVRVKDSSPGKSDFVFLHAINADNYRVLTPSVPAWAIDMPVDTHPNDIKTLVRVVNMLGQEVVSENEFKGEILLYMYNDGSVEKKMVE